MSSVTYYKFLLIVLCFPVFDDQKLASILKKSQNPNLYDGHANKGVAQIADTYAFEVWTSF